MKNFEGKISETLGIKVTDLVSAALLMLVSLVSNFLLVFCAARDGGLDDLNGLARLVGCTRRLMADSGVTDCASEARRRIAILYALYGLTCVGFCVQAGTIIDGLVENPSASYHVYKWPLGLAGMAVLVLTYYSVAQASLDFLIFHTIACLAAMIERFREELINVETAGKAGRDDGPFILPRQQQKRGGAKAKKKQQQTTRLATTNKLVEQTLGVVAFINEKYLVNGGGVVAPAAGAAGTGHNLPPPPPAPSPLVDSTKGMGRYLDGIGAVHQEVPSSAFTGPPDASIDELLEIGFRLKDMFRLANAGFSPFVVVMFISSGAASTIGFFNGVVGVSLLFGSSSSDQAPDEACNCEKDSTRDRVFYLQSLASIDSLFLGVASLLRLYYMTNVGQRLRGAVRKVIKKIIYLSHIPTTTVVVPTST